MDKKQISHALHEISVFLELLGENQFKIRAYQNGARAVETLEGNLQELVENERIGEIKGIGKTLAENIRELVLTGDLAYYHELKNSIPSGLLEILAVPGLGPKKVYKLYQTLEIASLAELEYACRENRLLELKGFGSKTQTNILKGIEYIKKFQGKFLYGDINGLSLKLLKNLQGCRDVIEADVAGSLRRVKEIVKDIDLVASSLNTEKVIEFFCSLSEVTEVVARGDTKASIRLNFGITADLRVVKPSEYATVLHHFTGSKEHNTALRQRAKKMGIKINEYGLFKGEDRIEIKDEKEFFQALNLQYIPPELRENRGEIEAAEKGDLPKLINYEDIQGVFHLHTNYSDGIHTVHELVEAAKKLGLKYIGISDHSQSAVYAHGLKTDAIKRQQQEIQEFNRMNSDFYVFHGIEADILTDGSLDYPDEVLELFDFVIASVHSGFSITGEKAVVRLIKAMENPYVTMLGHPTGRILLGRQGYEPDMEKLIEKAKENDVIIELNASPFRLDIDWRYLKYAKDRGVKISINPDAHRKEELSDTLFGVKIARKGWIEKKDVFNTQSLEEIKKYFLDKKNSIKY